MRTAIVSSLSLGLLASIAAVAACSAGTNKDSANFDPGALSRDFTQYNATPSSAVLGTGNGLLFSLAPVLQVSGSVTGSTVKTYDGGTDSAAVLGAPTLVGLLPGGVQDAFDDSVYLRVVVAVPVHTGLAGDHSYVIFEQVRGLPGPTVVLVR